MKNNLPKIDQIFFKTPDVFFLLQKNLSRKMMCSKTIFGRLGSFNHQNHFPLQFTKNIWLKRFNMDMSLLENVGVVH
jgi:hypothetical protein